MQVADCGPSEIVHESFYTDHTPPAKQFQRTKFNVNNFKYISNNITAELATRLSSTC